MRYKEILVYEPITPSGYKAQKFIEQTASSSPTAGGAETLNALSNKLVYAQTMPSGYKAENLIEQTASSSPTAGGAGGAGGRGFFTCRGDQ